MIILNEKYKHGDFTSPLNSKVVRSSTSTSQYPLSSFETILFKDKKQDTGAKKVNGSMFLSHQTKQISNWHSFPQYYSEVSVTHEPQESEMIFTKSKYKKSKPHDFRASLPILQDALTSGNSVIHYHEHEHVHRQNNFATSSHDLPSRLKHSNSERHSYFDQTFESLKKYYHQRDDPNNYHKRKRHKQKLNANRNNRYYNYTNVLGSLEGFSHGFGTKQHSGSQRGDLYF